VYSSPPISLRWRFDGEDAWRVFDPFARSLPRAPRHPVPRFPTEAVGVLYVLAGPLASENAIAAGKKDQRFVLVLTHVDTGGLPCPSGAWDSRSLPDGEHVLQVEALDSAGNIGRGELRFRLRNAAPPPRPEREPSLLDLLPRVAGGPSRVVSLGAAYEGEDLPWMLELASGADPLRVRRVSAGKGCSLLVPGGGTLPFEGWSLPLSLSTRGRAPGSLETTVDLTLTDGAPRRWLLRGESVPFLRGYPEEPVLARGLDGILRGKLLLAAEETFALDGATIRSDRGEFPLQVGSVESVGSRHGLFALEAAPPAGEGTRVRIRIRTRIRSGSVHATEWPVRIEVR
jgi:hypothetical protein